MIHILTTKESEALKEIRDSIMRRGKAPSVRELMSALGYRSPRSASVLIERLIEKGMLRKRKDSSLQLLHEPGRTSAHAQTVNIPLVGYVTCGAPILADENIEAYIPISTRLARPPHRYFLLKATGDSMNEAGIQDQDLVLIRQQETANNGDVIVALIDSEATVKEFQHSHNMIVLKPRSTNKTHQPIILTDEFQIQGLVVCNPTQRCYELDFFYHCLNALYSFQKRIQSYILLMSLYTELICQVPSYTPAQNLLSNLQRPYWENRKPNTI